MVLGEKQDTAYTVSVLNSCMDNKKKNSTVTGMQAKNDLMCCVLYENIERQAL